MHGWDVSQACVEPVIKADLCSTFLHRGRALDGLMHQQCRARADAYALYVTGLTGQWGLSESINEMLARRPCFCRHHARTRGSSTAVGVRARMRASATGAEAAGGRRCPGYLPRRWPMVVCASSGGAGPGHSFIKPRDSSFLCALKAEGINQRMDERYTVAMTTGYGLSQRLLKPGQGAEDWAQAKL